MPHDRLTKKLRAKGRYAERKMLGLCVICGSNKIKTKVYCLDCNNRKAETQKRSHEKLRLEVFKAYGGFRCGCCGEGEQAFLTIDHINGGGNEHRRQLGSSSMFYTWLRKNNFPVGYQVLCMNCNYGRSRNGGTCPHKVTNDQHHS